MTDRPIIFSSNMVLALLREVDEQGTGKSMTRRVAWVERKARADAGMLPMNACVSKGCERRPGFYWVPSPWQKAAVGDRLWVRESYHALGSWNRRRFTWAEYNGRETKFDGIAASSPRTNKIDWWTRPAIHIPRKASRLTLVVTGTKIERLHDISEQDCEREGVERMLTGLTRGRHRYRIYTAEQTWTSDPRDSFRSLWTLINGPESWRDNPEVVALTFTVHLRNVDAMEKAS